MDFMDKRGVFPWGIGLVSGLGEVRGQVQETFLFR